MMPEWLAPPFQEDSLPIVGRRVIAEAWEALERRGRIKFNKPRIIPGYTARQQAVWEVVARHPGLLASELRKLCDSTDLVGVLMELERAKRVRIEGYVKRFRYYAQ